MQKNKEIKRRPGKVSAAVTLLWTGIAMGVILNAIEFSNSLQIMAAYGFDSGFVIFVQIFFLAFNTFFVYMIGKGQNWARITFLVLFIIGAPASILGLFITLPASLISGIFRITIIILQIIALIFLFQKPSSDWFESMKK